jgi:inosine/guanosine/xanthosine phosphorylase family protein
VNEKLNASLAVILGSGLGGVVDGFSTDASILFDDVPGLTRPAVAGHGGEIRLCTVEGHRVLFVRGRKHYYEGQPAEIESLIRFIGDARVKRMIVTSAAGSLVRTLAPGEIVLVRDIIDRQNRHPDTEARPDGPARPDAADRLGLDGRLTRQIARSALAAGISLVTGTLYCAAGPTFETHADAFWLRGAGASVATMSAAPEVAIANRLGIQVACLAIVTNWVTGVSTGPLTHTDVLETGRGVSGTLGGLIGVICRSDPV